MHNYSNRETKPSLFGIMTNHFMSVPDFDFVVSLFRFGYGQLENDLPI